MKELDYPCVPLWSGWGKTVEARKRGIVGDSGNPHVGGTHAIRHELRAVMQHKPSAQSPSPSLVSVLCTVILYLACRPFGLYIYRFYFRTLEH